MATTSREWGLYRRLHSQRCSSRWGRSFPILYRWLRLLDFRQKFCSQLDVPGLTITLTVSMRLGWLGSSRQFTWVQRGSSLITIMKRAWEELSHSGYWCFGCSTTDYVAPLDTSAPWMHQHPGCSLFGFYDMANQPPVRQAPVAQPTTYNRDLHIQARAVSRCKWDHQTLRLYQERLVANKQRVKTGK